MSIKVAILGATGVVGQKAIALLEQMAGFEVAELVASEQRIGSEYSSVVNWRESLMPLPGKVGKLILKSVEDLQSDYIISCLPGDIAEKMEPYLAGKGKMVFSNASTFRMDPKVPLLIPEINSAHLNLLNKQSTAGKIVTNPNCSVVGSALAIAPVMALAEIERIDIVTMQSISGAGYPGVASMDILGNTIPHISEEAEKIAEEIPKILGSAEQATSFPVYVHVHRVPVMFGHTITLHITFKQSITLDAVAKQYCEWNKKHPNLFTLHNVAGRPQALKDLTHDDLGVHLGHFTLQNNVLGVVSVSHNLVRGAAGAALLNLQAYLKQSA